MPKSHKLCLGLAFLTLACVPAWGQGSPPAQVVPIPIPGGDVVLPTQPIPAGGVLTSGFINQFFPGSGSTFDGVNAEPHGVTNFRGVTAMGYTNGLATDNAGKVYQVITDIRVYQGDYIGAQATFGGGGSTSAKAHGTFVEI